MSANGTDDVEIGIRVNTSQIDKANKSLEELSNALEKLRGSTSIGTTGASQVNAYNSALEGLKTKLGSLTPNSDKAFQAMSQLNRTTLDAKVIMAGTGASFAGLANILGKLDNRDFTNMWDQFKSLPTEDVDKFAAAVTKLRHSKNEGNKFAGDEFQALGQIIYEATDETSKLGNALSKVRGRLLTKEEMELAFGGTKPANIDAAVSNIRSNATKAQMDLDKQAVKAIEDYDKATEKLTATIEKLAMAQEKLRMKGLVEEYNAEEKAANKTADAQERLAAAELKFQGKGLDRSMNERSKTDAADTKGIIDRLTKEGQINELYGDFAPLINGLQRVSNEEKRTTLVAEAMGNAHRMTFEELSALTGGNEKATKSMQDMSRAMEKVNEDSQMQQAYMTGSRAAIGPLGSMFREVTMQIYWAALGFLFLTMTMTRAEAAHIKAQTNANNIAKSYYNLDKLQKQVTKSLQEYGAGSQQAADASVNYLMAQKDLELQQDQLALTLKSEVLMGYQQTLSLIPLVVNGAYMLMTVFASLKGVQSAYNVSVLQGASAQATANAMSKATIGSKLTEAEAQIISTIATQSGTGATATQSVVTVTKGVPSQVMFAGILKMSTFWANALTAALTLGVGVIISYAASTVMMSMASAEADKQLKEMEASAKSLGNQFINTGSSGEAMALTFSGHSVDTSAIKAKNAIALLNTELKSLQLNKVSEIKANIDTSSLKNTTLEGNLGNKGANININFNGVTVRDNTDVDLIVNKVYDSLNREYNAAGVKM